jgi:phage terminase large subunit-like protein
VTQAKKRVRRRPTSIDLAVKHAPDPASAYAKAVDDGLIVAGPLVQKACERHLRDVKDQKKRKLVWSMKHADRVYGYFRDVLRLNGGQFEGQPFELRLWQAFIIGSTFGWLGADGFRRFRTAYIEIGKGNGKSPMAAGAGLYGLTADGEARAEVYAAASTKDQAMILFRDAVAMRQQSPMLTQKLIPYGGLNVWNMFYPATDSFFRTISADDRQSGPRPHFALCDELHEHQDGGVVEMLHHGFKFRRQPMIFEITNSGVDRNSICYQHHEYSQRVLEGRIDDDTWFAYVCGLHEKDDWRDERVWIKANPNLGASITEKYLRESVKKAQGMPTLASSVRRLNFCEWVGAATPWIDFDKWSACEVKGLDIAQYRGSRCWAGIDLSAKNDLTALALVFMRPDGGGLDAFVYFWTPRDGLKNREDRDRVPYTVWVDQKHLEATEGATVDYGHVARRLVHFAEDYGLHAAAFDRWRIEDLKRELDDEAFEYSVVNLDVDDEKLKQTNGLLLVNHGQGFRDMTSTVEALTEEVVDGRLKVQWNPVLTMCSANAVVTSGSAEEKKFDKRKSRGRIDGVVALAMAVRAAKVFGGRQTGTIYDREGLFVV